MRPFMRCVSICALGFVVACDRQPNELTYAELTPAESQFVTRFVVLERARAATLADPELGPAILDSLAAAWGDSAAVEAERALPSDSARAELLHDLLRRILEAEQDSLISAPRRDRLALPLPTPVPVPDDATR